MKLSDYNNIKIIGYITTKIKCDLCQTDLMKNVRDPNSIGFKGLGVYEAISNKTNKSKTLMICKDCIKINKELKNK